LHPMLTDARPAEVRLLQALAVQDHALITEPLQRRSILL
jgi:hypothetical protein